MIVDEPDWEACIAAAEEVTGLPVDRHTTSIIIREVRKWLSVQPAEPVPIDMVLHCPACGMQHVDDAETGIDPRTGTEWVNPPHRSHLCHGCGTIWRPADVPTNGVADVKTRGKADTWPVNAEEITAQPAPSEPAGWRCFHCDEMFTEPEAAALHFGKSEMDRPFCQIDVAHFRWMEAQHRRNVDDDSEALRTVGSLVGEHERLRRQAEELGYARGLADAQKHPEDLGLAAAPQPAAKGGEQ